MNAPEDLVTAGTTEVCDVQGVKWLTLEKFADNRGPLVVLGQKKVPLPFVPVRVFFTYGASGQMRGQHSHRKCEQLLICVAGRMQVSVDDGHHRAEFALAGPENAVYVPPMVWAEQYGHSKDAVLMVLASHPYEEQDYIRDRTEWLRAVRSGTESR